MKKLRFVGPLVFLPLAIVLLSGCWSDPPKAVAKMRVKELGLLLSMTIDSNNDTLPDMTSAASVKDALQPALAAKRAKGGAGDWNDGIFIDPLSEQPFVPNPRLSKLTLSEVSKIAPPSTIIAFYSPKPSEGGRAVGYVDSHVEWIPEEQWPARKKEGHVG